MRNRRLSNRTGANSKNAINFESSSAAVLYERRPCSIVSRRFSGPRRSYGLALRTLERFGESEKANHPMATKATCARFLRPEHVLASVRRSHCQQAVGSREYPPSPGAAHGMQLTLLLAAAVSTL